VCISAIDGCAQRLGPGALGVPTRLRPFGSAYDSLRLLLYPHNLGRQRFHLLLQPVRPLPFLRQRPIGLDVGHRQRGFQLVDLHPQRIRPRPFLGAFRAYVRHLAEALTGHAFDAGVVKGKPRKVSEANEHQGRDAVAGPGARIPSDSRHLLGLGQALLRRGKQIFGAGAR
jgi:hypothetical protein